MTTNTNIVILINNNFISWILYPFILRISNILDIYLSFKYCANYILYLSDIIGNDFLESSSNYLYILCDKKWIGDNIAGDDLIRTASDIFISYSTLFYDKIDFSIDFLSWFTIILFSWFSVFNSNCY